MTENLFGASNRYPIALLEALVVVSESASLDQAAMQLGLTQPALSKQLRRLEDAMPLPLFTQVGRRKKLTPFAQVLATSLKPRLSGLDDLIRQAALSHLEPREANIRIAGRRGLLDRFSAKLRFPGTLTLSESSNEQTLALVLAAQAEIGIVHQLPDSTEVMAKPLVTENFQIVIPKKLLRHFSKAELNRVLQTLPCLAFKPDDEILKSLCTKRKIDSSRLKVIRSTENYASLAQMVEESLGWAVLPKYLPVSKVRNWRIAFASPALSDRKFYLIFRKELSSLKWFKELLAEIQNQFR